MALQIFGTKKCPDTRKAERFFSERGVKYQLIDLAETGISPGELRSVREAVGADVLIDRDGERFKRRGLGYMDFDIEEEILADPLLLKSPIVRDGRKAAVGYRPEVWERCLEP
jgi:arsenate reductase-like glutaredoxin family protein